MQINNENRRIAGEIAREYGFPESHVLAVVAVESDGQVFTQIGNRREPLILFEPHIFFRRLSGKQRDAAVAAGLAYQKQGSKKYPKKQAERWVQLKDAAAINPIAAYESASYGVAQVMGFHWKALGFDSVNAMVDQARTGFKGQIDLMIRYVKANGLDDELIEGRWAAFARGYNGPNYKKNNYDERLKQAALLYGGDAPEPNGMLRMGSKGRRVRELQALLIRAGYSLKEDGDFGMTTRDALKGFQASKGLTADGVYGPETEGALASLRQAQDDRPGRQVVTKIAEVQKGAAGGLLSAGGLATAKETLSNTAAEIAGFGVSSVLIDYVQTALGYGIVACAIGGLAYAAIGWMKSKRTVEV